MDDEKEMVPVEVASFMLVRVFTFIIYLVYFVDLEKMINEIRRSNRLLYSLTFSARLLLLRSSLRLTFAMHWVNLQGIIEGVMEGMKLG